MFLSNFSVRRPVATVVILIALMAAGLMALNKLKVNQNPDIDLPMLVVDIAFPVSYTHLTLPTILLV